MGVSIVVEQVKPPPVMLACGLSAGIALLILLPRRWPKCLGFCTQVGDLNEVGFGMVLPWPLPQFG